MNKTKSLYPFYYSIDGKKKSRPVMASTQRLAKRIIKTRLGRNCKIEFRNKNDKPVHYNDFAQGFMM